MKLTSVLKGLHLGAEGASPRCRGDLCLVTKAIEYTLHPEIPMNKVIDEKGERSEGVKLYLFQDDCIKGKNNLSFLFHSRCLSLQC